MNCKWAKNAGIDVKRDDKHDGNHFFGFKCIFFDILRKNKNFDPKTEKVEKCGKMQKMRKSRKKKWKKSKKAKNRLQMCKKCQEQW